MTGPPLVPVRMVNEYVYCPRLAYMMWVQGEFAHSADTVEGAIRHKRVDKEGGKLPADLEDAPETEIEAAEEQFLDQATAARTLVELKAEIDTLSRLERLAQQVRSQGTDTKWQELAGLLHTIFTAAGPLGTGEPEIPYGAGPIPPPKPSAHQKLVLFTEHRDTLNYLESRITTLLGRKSAVVVIHGGIGREERMKIQEAFKHDPRCRSCSPRMRPARASTCSVPT